MVFKNISSLLNSSDPYINNLIWITSVRVCKAITAILITIIFARYLGVEQFGQYSFALSFAMLFSILVTLGLENIVVRELISKKNDQSKIINSAIFLRLAGSLCFIFLTYLAISLVKPFDRASQCLVLIFSTGLVFKTFEILRHYFEAFLIPKPSSILELSIIAFSIAFKLILIYFEASITALALSFILDSILLSSGLLIIYFYNSERSRIILELDFRNVKYLFNEAKPLILSGGLYLIYSKIDQVMLNYYVGNLEVGIYAAAAKLSEGWLFLPTAIAAALFPKLVDLSNNSEKKNILISQTQKLMKGICFLSILVACFCFLFSDWIIISLYGINYTDSILVLKIHIWSGLFIALNAITSRYLIIKGLQRFALYRGLLGLAINIILNIWLIPLYGAVGSAISTVASQLISLYLANAFNKSTRDVFYMQTKALLWYKL